MTKSDARWLRAMAIAAEVDDAEDLAAERLAHRETATLAERYRIERNAWQIAAALLALALLGAMFQMGRMAG